MEFFLYIILAFAPSLIWLFFFLQEEIHPEPKKLLTQTFFLGAAFALAAALAQKFFLDFLGIVAIAKYSLLSFFILALIEEASKFCAAYFSLERSPFLNQPIEEMLYMVAAAMGFATVENIFVAINGFWKEFLTFPEISNILILRFVGATLLHALSAALVGYYWSKHRLLFGLIFAALLHSFFNFLIIIYSASAIYPLIFLTIFAIFIFRDFEKAKSNHE